MKRITLSIVLIILLAVAGDSCASRQAVVYNVPGPGGVVDFGIFYDSLSPYGRWFSVVEYGWVWSPYDVSVSWQPYTHGYWIFSDYGWTWVSQWDWGWGPFHYGRWVHQPRYGWFWVPGTVWGPAWVVWRHRPGWIGWAPMPPHRGWRPGSDFQIWNDSDRSIDAYFYNFVEERNFATRDLKRHLQLPARNVTLIQGTRETTDYRVTQNRAINRSFEAEQIERATGRPVTRHRMTDTNSPRGGEKVSGNDVRVYRPNVSRPTTERTPQTTSTQRPATPQELNRREQQENRQLQIEQERSRKVLEDQHRAEQSRAAQRQIEQEQIRKQQEAERRALDEQMRRQQETLKNRQDTRRQTQPPAQPVPQRKPAEQRQAPPQRTPPRKP